MSKFTSFGVSKCLANAGFRATAENGWWLPVRVYRVDTLLAWLLKEHYVIQVWHGTDNLYHAEQRGYVYRTEQPIACSAHTLPDALAGLVMKVLEAKPC